MMAVSIPHSVRFYFNTYSLVNSIRCFWSYVVQYNDTILPTLRGSSAEQDLSRLFPEHFSFIPADDAIRNDGENHASNAAGKSKKKDKDKRGKKHGKLPISAICHQLILLLTISHSRTQSLHRRKSALWMVIRLFRR